MTENAHADHEYAGNNNFEQPNPETFDQAIGQDQLPVTRIPNQNYIEREPFTYLSPSALPLEKPTEELARKELRNLERSSASAFYEFLKLDIQNLEAGLEGDDLLLVYYCSPAGEQIILEGIQYYDPVLLALAGHDAAGNRCRVIIPLSQAQIIAKVVKNVVEKPKAKFGFVP
jgi:hypothetical protein